MKPRPSPLAAVFWALVAILGAGSLAVLALSRGETVSALWVVLAAVCVFMIAWRFHSSWLAARVLALDEMRATPAVVREDGRDFVPTNRWVVFGHHFAAIAGPGPLVGPVLAAQFGFMPGLLWMLIGATLGGAVHDCLILFCSLRRGGRSLGQMMRDEVGPFAGLVTLCGTAAILVILIAVLGLVVVKALAESPWGLSTILASMPIAIIMGVAMHKTRGRVGLVSLFGVIALLLSVFAGQWLPGTALEHWLTLDGRTLAIGIGLYALIASSLPVWLLLAPRDYLSCYLKIGTVALLGIAIVILAPRLQMPAVTRFVSGNGPVVAGPVFPFCFITIACAAISGFHALIASGTTPKLLARERDIRVVGYGAMIVEMLVGVMALIAACVMQPGEYFAINIKGAPADVAAQVTALGFPVTPAHMAALAASVGEHTMIGRTGGAPTFALGMAHMFGGIFHGHAAMSLWYHFAIMFEAMFILTTIDAGTRVGRFMFQDILGYFWKPLARPDWLPANGFAGLLFVCAWGWFLWQGVVDPLGGINSLWPIFGIANQLLGVIALALGATILIKMGRRQYLWVPCLPLAWLMAVTMTAGWMKIFSPDPHLGFISAANDFQAKIARGGAAAQLATWHSQMINSWIDAGVTGFFVVMVLLIVGACGHVWWLSLVKQADIGRLGEEPYVALSGDPAMS
jgi:carbon starvation protein